MSGLGPLLAILGLFATPGLAYAHGRPGSPESTFQKVYLDSERCAVLIDQARQLIAGGRASPQAIATASHGIELCRASDYAAGADALAAAVETAGEVPALPAPRIPLR